MTESVELKREALRIAHQLRLGQDVQAQLDMVVLAERLAGFADGEQGEGMAAWVGWINQATACQETQDWLGLADYLEYELLDLLDRAV